MHLIHCLVLLFLSHPSLTRRCFLEYRTWALSSDDQIASADVRDFENDRWISRVACMSPSNASRNTRAFSRIFWSSSVKTRHGVVAVIGCPITAAFTGHEAFP